MNNIDLTSLFLQIYNLVLLLQDFKNSDLMGELQKQDKQYLEKIINQNNEILEILKRKEEKMEETLKETCKKSLEKIKEINENDITPSNVGNLYQLVDIVKDIKEVENMYGNYGNYGNYGYGARRPGYDSYGRGGYGEYGRRGYDMKYRGDEELDRMYGEYGRYQESRGRYGAGDQETDKSFHYMVKALEDFIRVLHEEAETPQQKQQLMQALQNSMM